MPYTINQIIPVIYPAILNELLDGRQFIDRKLRCKYSHNKIQVRPLGIVVEEAIENGPSIRHDISELVVTLVWSPLDDFTYPEEMSRIRFARGLIKTALATHDNLLLQNIGSGRAVVSETYKYGRSEIIVLNSGSYSCKIYTVAAFIPKRT